MPDPSPRKVPTLRHHKATGQGYVELNGKRLYLGRYDAPETEREYHRLIAEWLANGRRLPVPPDQITIAELLARFAQHIDATYTDESGNPSEHANKIKRALRPVRRLYAHTRADDFGPMALKAVRQAFIDAGQTRGVVNESTGFVRMMFAWATENELISPNIYHGLLAVKGLRRGRSDAAEPDPVTPVPLAHVDAIQQYVNRQVWALIQVQLHTAARAGELVIMRPIDLDTGGRVWSYKPTTHKTAYRGQVRTIYVGPRAQAAIEPFLSSRASVEDYLFSPAEAEAERRAKLSAERQTPHSCGNRPGTNRRAKPRKQPAAHYTTASYRRAITNACDKAGVPRWTPHQLRHTAATMIRREHGIELAQTILGHRMGSAITEVYAEANVGGGCVVSGFSRWASVWGGEVGWRMTGECASAGG